LARDDRCRIAQDQGCIDDRRHFLNPPLAGVSEPDAIRDPAIDVVHLDPSCLRLLGTVLAYIDKLMVKEKSGKKASEPSL